MVAPRRRPRRGSSAAAVFLSCVGAGESGLAEESYDCLIMKAGQSPHRMTSCGFLGPGHAWCDFAAARQGPDTVRGGKVQRKGRDIGGGGGGIGTGGAEVWRVQGGPLEEEDARRTAPQRAVAGATTGGCDGGVDDRLRSNAWQTARGSGGGRRGLERGRGGGAGGPSGGSGEGEGAARTSVFKVVDLFCCRVAVLITVAGRR